MEVHSETRTRRMAAPAEAPSRSDYGMKTRPKVSCCNCVSTPKAWTSENKIAYLSVPKPM
eukprot:1063793-Amphidinium_carterae.1